MELLEAVQKYDSCPYVRSSLSGVCDNCPLHQHIAIGNSETWLETSLCRLIEAIDNALTEDSSV